MGIDQAEIVDRYRTGETITEIAPDFGVSPANIWYYLRKNNVDTSRKKKNLAERKFREIDSPEKAYWLGLLYADGSTSAKKQHWCISLGLIDREHVDKFRKFIESEHPISKRRNDHSHFGKKDYWEISIPRKVLVQDLVKHGLIPNKSHRMKYPNIEFDSHFIRGLFDGDGTIKVHGRAHEISLVGASKPFITSVRDKICSILDLKKPPICSDGKVWRFSFTSKGSVKAVLSWMYQGSTNVIRLNRKFQRAIKMLKRCDSNFRSDKVNIPKDELEHLYWREGKSSTVIAELFGVSPKTILNRMKEHGLKRRPSEETPLKKRGIQYWTDAEIEVLKSEYPISATTDMAKRLRRTEQSVKNKAHEIGVRKRREK